MNPLNNLSSIESLLQGIAVSLHSLGIPIQQYNAYMREIPVLSMYMDMIEKHNAGKCALHEEEKQKIYYSGRQDIKKSIDILILNELHHIKKHKVKNPATPLNRLRKQIKLSGRQH